MGHLFIPYRIASTQANADPTSLPDHKRLADNRVASCPLTFPPVSPQTCARFPKFLQDGLRMSFPFLVPYGF